MELWLHYFGLSLLVIVPAGIAVSGLILAISGIDGIIEPTKWRRVIIGGLVMTLAIPSIIAGGNVAEKRWTIPAQISTPAEKQ